MATLLQSLPYKEWIIGVGLDSAEHNNPPVKFAQVFRRAQAEGYFLTMYCDVDQQDAVKHIWQAIRDIGVHRIDHGVNALEDQQLCDEIKRRSLALTVGPISNASVSDSSKAEVIKVMLAQGKRVTVNSDAPAYFVGYMTENLLRVQKEAELSRSELAQLSENAFKSAWLPRLTRDLYVAELKAYIRQAT